MEPYIPYFDTTNYNTPYTYFKCILNFPLVIIRSILFVSNISIFYICSKVLDKKYASSMITIASKIWVYSFGYHNIKIKNKEYIQTAVTNKAIFVYNHSTIVDGHILSGFIYPFAPVIYYKFYNHAKTLLDFCDGICINDDKKNSANSNKIIEHIKTKKRLVPIAPEGVTTNGEYLLQFKTGAFITTQPIQPVILKYPNRYIKSILSVNVSPLFIIYYTMAQFINTVEIELLPLQYIKPNETPIEFAERVRKLMSDASGLTMINVDGRGKSNAFKYYEQIQKHKVNKVD